MQNQNDTPKPADAEQPSGKGLDETICSPSSMEEATSLAREAFDEWMQNPSGNSATANLRNKLCVVIGERENYLKALRVVLASARPHPMENGQMYHAWEEARKILPENVQALTPPSQNSSLGDNAAGGCQQRLVLPDFSEEGRV